MVEASSIRCYVEAYEGARLPGLRLGEKGSRRRVTFGQGSEEARRHLVQFLAAAKQHSNELPGMFSKDDEQDCVLVSGDVELDVVDEIRFVYNDNLSYLFA